MALSDFNQFPGGELIWRGVEDLPEARESVEALLVLIGNHEPLTKDFSSWQPTWVEKKFYESRQQDSNRSK